jgi:hypothetical protein
MLGSIAFSALAASSNHTPCACQPLTKTRLATQGFFGPRRDGPHAVRDTRQQSTAPVGLGMSRVAAPRPTSARFAKNEVVTWPRDCKNSCISPSRATNPQRRRSAIHAFGVQQLPKERASASGGSSCADNGLRDDSARRSPALIAIALRPWDTTRAGELRCRSRPKPSQKR